MLPTKVQLLHPEEFYPDGLEDTQGWQDGQPWLGAQAVTVAALERLAAAFLSGAAVPGSGSLEAQCGAGLRSLGYQTPCAVVFLGHQLGLIWQKAR